MSDDELRERAIADDVGAVTRMWGRAAVLKALDARPREYYDGLTRGAAEYKARAEAAEAERDELRELCEARHIDHSDRRIRDEIVAKEEAEAKVARVEIALRRHHVIDNSQGAAMIETRYVYAALNGDTDA